MNKANQINFHYDSDVDILYASMGVPKPAASVEKGNGTILRIDPVTGDLVGFTVIHYMERIKSGLLDSIPGFEGIELPIY